MKTMFKWRHQYDADADAVERERTAIDCSNDPVLTQQQFAADADINVLVERFKIAREPLPTPQIDPRYYGDVSEAPDLRTVLERTRAAQERFAALPVKVRNRFRNSPAELYDFLMDPGNRNEAVALGLLVAHEEPADRPAPRGEVTSSPAPAPAAP